MTTDHLQKVRDLADAAKAAHAELRRGCAQAVWAGRPVTEIADAAGVTRQTIYRWADELASERPTPQWVVHTPYGDSTIDGPLFPQLGPILTDMPVRSEAFDGPMPQDLRLGGTTVLQVVCGHTGQARSSWRELRYLVERVR